MSLRSRRRRRQARALRRARSAASALRIAVEAARHGARWPSLFWPGRFADPKVEMASQTRGRPVLFDVLDDLAALDELERARRMQRRIAGLRT